MCACDIYVQVEYWIQKRTAYAGSLSEPGGAVQPKILSPFL
jgi:hypothetical protein